MMGFMTAGTTQMRAAVVSYMCLEVHFQLGFRGSYDINLIILRFFFAVNCDTISVKKTP